MRNVRNPLQQLTFIQPVNKRQGKVTGQYAIKSQPIHVKNKVIVKQYYLSKKTLNTQLLLRKFNGLSTKKQLHPIKELFLREETDQTVFIVVEGYHSFGNLTQVIKGSMEINYQLWYNIAVEMAELHGNNLGHFNLKPENILLSKDIKSVKFTDPRIYSLDLTCKDPSSQYLPPQCRQFFASDQRIDVWSLGVIFLEILLHRRIEASEASVDNLSRLIKTLPNTVLTTLLSGMCCEQDKRFPIGQVINLIKILMNGKKQHFQPYSFQTIRIPLFGLDSHQYMDDNPIQTVSHTTKSWSLKINLYEKDRVCVLSLIFDRQTIKIIKTYRFLPESIAEFYTKLEDLFVDIKYADKQGFCLENDGSFSFRKRIDQSCQQQKQQQIHHEIIINDVFQEAIICEDKAEPQTKKQDACLPFIQTKEQKIETINEDTSSSEQEEQDFLTAFTKFPTDKPAVKRIISTIKIATSLSQLNIEFISTLYQKLGLLLEQKPDLAILSFKLARYGYRKLSGKNSDKEMTLLINLGAAYARCEQYSQASLCFRKSINIANQLNDLQIANLGNNNLGGIATLCNDYSVAEHCYLDCINLCQKMLDKTNLYIAQDNLANLYLKQQNYHQTNIFIERISKTRQLQPSIGFGILTFNWAFSLFHLGKYKESFEKFSDVFKQKYNPTLKSQLQKCLLLEMPSKKVFIRQLPLNLLQKVKKNFSQQNQRRFDQAMII